MFVKLLNGTVVDVDFPAGSGEDLYRAVHAALPIEDRPPLWRMMLMRDGGALDEWIRPDGEPVDVDLNQEVLSLWIEPYDYQWSYHVADRVVDAVNPRMPYVAVDLFVICEGERIYTTRLFFQGDWRGCGFFRDDEVAYDPVAHTITVERMDWIHDDWDDVLADADLSLCAKTLLSMEMRYDPVLSKFMRSDKSALGECTMYLGDAADML
jgi:hypothetical protein